MGISSSTNYKFASYKDVQNIIRNTQSNSILLNTMTKDKQQCIIKGTCDIHQEEYIINNSIQNNSSTLIIIYGCHNCDQSVFKKFQQLRTLGFCNVYIYSGGLFEWLCLQDIYGDEFFQTTNKSHSKIELLDFAPNEYCNLLYSKQITNP